MQTRVLTDKEAAKEVLRLVQQADRVSIAVAWATKNAVTESILSSGKVERAIIGTHMFITDPAVLREFAQFPQSRVIAPDEPKLFHPKVYLFEQKGGFAAIVGSHNMTRGAFESNVEASILLEGESSASVLRDLKGFIDQSWEAGEPIDERKFLFGYERQYVAKRRAREELKTFHRLSPPAKDSKEPSPLDLDWREFSKRVKEQEQLDNGARMRLLQRASELFAENKHFSAMERHDRRCIAATLGRVERKQEDINWAWFGNMSGHGDFQSLVNESPELLSEALDHIPSVGDVTEEQYAAFVETFNSAFEGKAHRGSYPVASRLLAMKRPDQFVAVNSQNVKGLCEALDVPWTRLNLENYWQRIVVPIRNSPWWFSARPAKREAARLWDFRVAMLDSIYYLRGIVED